MESVPQVSDQSAVPSAIGQGTHNYTTVGIARYATTIANRGTCYNLSLLDKVTDVNGNLIEDFNPEVRNTVELADNVWNALHLGMRKVVQKKAFYNTLSVEVAGKTGTAEENKSRPNHALFMGFAPYDNPEIAFATRIAFGYSSNYAAETTRDILEYYYGLEDTEELLSGTASSLDSEGVVQD